MQHDRGTNFVSGVFQEVMSELGISPAVSSAYHPESQGVFERTHQTLKSMIRTYSQHFPGDWDVALPLLLFALRDAMSESTGFSPFELFFGHEVRGPLKLVKESILQPKSSGSILQYVAEFKEALSQVARDNLLQAQARMKARANVKAVERTFEVGDQVLVLVPQHTSSLSASFCGPYTVIKVGTRNYVISTPEGRKKTRLCHINLSKRYRGRPSGPPVACAAMGVSIEEDGRDCGVSTGELSGPEVPGRSPWAPVSRMAG